MATGFKEWEAVCAAMGRGEQSIILRKGGIAEGRDGFQFKHPEFFLFPTLFHEQNEKIREEIAADPETPAGAGGKVGSEIRVSLFVRIDFHRAIDDWDRAAALEPFHIWSEDEIRKRFEWDEAPGISLAFVRVFRLAEPWCFGNTKGYGGCRSWVELPDPPPDLALGPVLADDAHACVKEKLLEVLG